MLIRRVSFCRSEEVQVGDEVVAVDGVRASADNVLALLEGSNAVASKCRLTLNRCRLFPHTQPSTLQASGQSGVLRTVPRREHHLRPRQQRTILLPHCVRW